MATADKNFKVKNGLDASGAVTITQPTTSTVPLTILANTLATGSNLFEVKRPDGSVRLSIGNDGALSSQNLSALNVRFYSANSGSWPLILRGQSSQTADLQQWRDIDENVLSSVSATGSISVGTPISNALISAQTSTASQVGIAVRGLLFQTADLQQWLSPYGTTFLRINNVGQIQAPQPASVGVVVKAAGFLQATITNVVGSGNSITYTATNTFQQGQVVTITGVSPAAYNLSLVTISDANATSFTISNTATGTYVSGGTATILQSANLQEWQDDSGTVLASIGPKGTVYMASTGSANIATFYNGSSGFGAGNISYNGIFNINAANMGFPYTSSGATLSVNATSATVKPITVRGFASQTANLQEWQNSAGTVLSWIHPAGYLTLGSATTIGGVLGINTGVSTARGIVVRGAASQSVNLQEWQASDGTVIASITPLGGITASSNITQSSSGRTFIGGAADAGAFLNIGIPTASRQGIVVRANASQTANLQEWQNSSGGVDTAITSTGRLSVRTTLADAGLNVGTPSAATVGAIVRGVTSQTANLQEWQNSAGTALAKVDNLGNFTATSKSFDIAHPTKENMRLRYGSLEGPENGAYIRGTTESNIIELPEYWTGLVHEDSITVSLTAVGSSQNIYVEKIENNKIYIGGNLEKAFFTVYGERKDIDKLIVEY
jgi:hypothetical protein